MVNYETGEFDNTPDEIRGPTSLVARQVVGRVIRHVLYQNEGKRFSGVVSHVEQDDWHARALVIPGLDTSQLHQEGILFPFYDIDINKKEVIQHRDIRAQDLQPNGLVPKQQIENLTNEFDRNELEVVYSMLGKAALLGKQENYVERNVSIALNDYYLHNLAHLFGNESDNEPTVEPYQEKLFLDAISERLHEYKDFETGPRSTCLAYSFTPENEACYIQVSSVFGEIEDATFIKKTRDNRLVSDAFSYTADDESEYSDFWDLDELVTTVRSGTEITADEFNDFLQKSELLGDS